MEKISDWIFLNEKIAKDEKDIRKINIYNKSNGTIIPSESRLLEQNTFILSLKRKDNFQTQ